MSSIHRSNQPGVDSSPYTFRNPSYNPVSSSSGSESDTSDNNEPSSALNIPGVPTRRSERAQAQECKALVDKLLLDLRALPPNTLSPICYDFPEPVYSFPCPRRDYMITLFMQARIYGSDSLDPHDGEFWDSLKVVAGEGVSDEMEDLPCRRFAVRFVRLRVLHPGLENAVGDVEYWTT
ncbi:hypothetical protein GL218_02130 [Daldinia childiae]|uniref:uncharacterized protein n=1 Tax=Daldinia childiae TaxID=326645 RepID=UPI00144740F1|nr:uncharacterized protein GL218_02130 [Daldinia childiae]KAF3063803.1 hypothetical protein GL218_02130 [Daldinia childiae]